MTCPIAFSSSFFLKSILYSVRMQTACHHIQLHIKSKIRKKVQFFEVALVLICLYATAKSINFILFFEHNDHERKLSNLLVFSSFIVILWWFLAHCAILLFRYYILIFFFEKKMRFSSKVWPGERIFIKLHIDFT